MVHRLQRAVQLAIPLDQAWEFFSDPRNLKVMTPPSLGIRMKATPPEKMYAGMILTYTVSPILSLPMTWVTEITQVREPYFFVDEQRYGPYKLWHHQHLFREVPGGVEVEDVVDYIMPMGYLGLLVHSVFVARQLREIFDFRSAVLAQRFGLLPTAQSENVFPGAAL